MADTEIIRDDARLVAIADEWSELWHNAANPSPFLHFDWVAMCWRRLALMAPRAPYIVIVRENGIAVLAAPLMPEASLVIFRAHSGLRSLLPQYDDVLVRDGADGRATIEALLRALGTDRFALRLRLNQLPSWSPVVAPLKEHATSQSTIRSGGLVEFADGYDAYFAQFSKQTRSQHRRLTKLLAQHGDVALHNADAKSFNADFDWLLAQKRAWRPPSGRLPRRWLSSPGTETDLRLLARGWLGDDRAWLSVLTVGKQRAAAALSLLGGRRDATYFVITYDPQFAHFSPGRILTLKVIEQLSARGIHCLDMMAGEGQWKQRLAPRTPPILKLRARLLRDQ